MIRAERALAYPPERVFEFLSDLRNHWRLESRVFVELQEAGQDGGVIELKGPLGLSRQAHTRVLAGDPHSRVAGRADLSGGTVGLVAWEIDPDGTGSLVRLSAEVAHASWPDRLLLAAGGRTWLRRLFERTLANLETAL